MQDFNLLIFQIYIQHEHHDHNENICYSLLWVPGTRLIENLSNHHHPEHEKQKGFVNKHVVVSEHFIDVWYLVKRHTYPLTSCSFHKIVSFLNKYTTEPCSIVKNYWKTRLLPFFSSRSKPWKNDKAHLRNKGR